MLEELPLQRVKIVAACGANYSCMTEMFKPYHHAQAMSGGAGGWIFDTVPGLTKVANKIARQPAMIG